MLYIKPTPVPVGHPGVDYLTFLEVISQTLAPKLYLEIGTNTGHSLSKISCDAVCVDPNFQIQPHAFRNKSRIYLYQMPSDAFFADVGSVAVLSNNLDIAFLDGMHRFEYLLRDFMNTELYCHERSVVLLHDCLPPTAEMADRFSATQINWAGDVWKLVPILRKYRPDLRVTFLDCPPTGIVACTRLDPQSRVLAREYHAILDEFGSVDLDDAGIERLWQSYPTLDSGRLYENRHDLTMFF